MAVTIFGDKSLDLSRPQIMGILNVTPDSFSDGGSFSNLDDALFQTQKMLSEGASIIDVGGESTRPGASPVSLEEELGRVIPVVAAIKSRFDVVVSVDTSSAQVMTEGAKQGAGLINDVRALQESGALEAAATAEVPVCLMHMKGQPRTMQNNPEYSDLIEEVSRFLLARAKVCEQAGIAKESILFDPGYGFGKTLEHNYHLLAHLEKFHQFGLPILAGMSRKSMIFKLLDKAPADCLAGSLACATLAAAKGAQIIRVHDAEETIEAMKIVQMMQSNI